MKKNKFSIIIPAYNEEKRIGKTLDAYTDFLNSEIKSGWDYEIVVVINNTKDRTEDVVKKAMRKNKRISYLSLKRGGKGYAVKEGFKSALKRDNEIIGFVDADMATPPKSFFYLVKNIGKADGAIASRYLPASKITPEFNLRRKLVARVFHSLVRALFFLRLTDTQCGAKVFTRRAARVIVDNVQMSQWAFDVELLYVMKKRGLLVRELPTRWREIEGSKIKVIKSSFQMFLSLIQLRILNSPFRKIMRPLKPVIGTFWRMIK